MSRPKHPFPSEGPPASEMAAVARGHTPHSENRNRSALVVCTSGSLLAADVTIQVRAAEALATDPVSILDVALALTHGGSRIAAFEMDPR